jgi:uncharacterized protein YacL
MRIEHVLYAIGILVAFVATLYFTWEYIVNLSRVAKFIILILTSILLISLGYDIQTRKRKA